MLDTNIMRLQVKMTRLHNGLEAVSDSKGDVPPVEDPHLKSSISHNQLKCQVMHHSRFSQAENYICHQGTQANTCKA